MAAHDHVDIPNLGRKLLIFVVTDVGQQDDLVDAPAGQIIDAGLHTGNQVL
jgi:hypothetical protein